MSERGSVAKRQRISLTICDETKEGLMAIQRALRIDTLARAATACVNVAIKAFLCSHKTIEIDTQHEISFEIGEIFKRYEDWEQQPDGTPPAKRSANKGLNLLYGSTCFDMVATIPQVDEDRTNELPINGTLEETNNDTQNGEIDEGGEGGEIG